VVEALGGIGEIDTGFFCEGLQDGLPDGVLGTAALAGMAQVADGHCHAVIDHLGPHDGRQVLEMDLELGGQRAHLPGHSLVELFRMLTRNPGKYLVGLLPVALEGDRDGYLIPYVLEALGVVGYRLLEDPSVRHVDDPAGALVGVHPVADLQ
jgi:hypothetical protein